MRRVDIVNARSAHALTQVLVFLTGVTRKRSDCACTANVSPLGARRASLSERSPLYELPVQRDLSGLSLKLSPAWTNTVLGYPYNRLYHQHARLQRFNRIGRK